METYRSNTDVVLYADYSASSQEVGRALSGSVLSGEETHDVDESHWLHVAEVNGDPADGWLLVRPRPEVMVLVRDVQTEKVEVLVGGRKRLEERVKLVDRWEAKPSLEPSRQRRSAPRVRRHAPESEPES